MTAQRPIPSDLTDPEWEAVRGLLPRARLFGRPDKYRRRAVVDAVLYVTRVGCAWQALPSDFPPWPTVYKTFRRWLANGTWGRVLGALGRDTPAGPIAPQYAREGCP